MVRRCWVNLQCRGVLHIWIEVGQGSTALAVGADGGCLDIFSLNYHFFLSPSLWETARYRLQYCLKGPLSPKQPTTISYPGAVGSNELEKKGKNFGTMQIIFCFYLIASLTIKDKYYQSRNLRSSIT